MSKYVIVDWEINYILFFSFADMNAEEVRVGVFLTAQFVAGEDTEIVVRARVLFEVLVLEMNNLP